MNIIITLFCALLTFAFPHIGSTFMCFTCTQSYRHKTSCSTIIPRDMTTDCQGSNAECFESIEWFQNGAIQWVRRGCYTNNATGGYCQNYPYKKTGVLKKCTACKKDRCNGHQIYKPLTQNQNCS